jgi:hypothetical protein
MRTEIDLQFADGQYLFKLGLAQIRELQDKTGTGIGALYARVLQGRIGDRLVEGHPAFAAYHVDDLRETVRQGLIGGRGGRVDDADVLVTPLRANELVERYLDAMPLAEQWNLAAAILFALVEGYADEESPRDEQAPGDEDKKKEAGLTTPPL